MLLFFSTSSALASPALASSTPGTYHGYQHGGSVCVMMATQPDAVSASVEFRPQDPIHVHLHSRTDHQPDTLTFTTTRWWQPQCMGMDVLEDQYDQHHVYGNNNVHNTHGTMTLVQNTGHYTTTPTINHPNPTGHHYNLTMNVLMVDNDLTRAHWRVQDAFPLVVAEQWGGTQYSLQVSSEPAQNTKTSIHVTSTFDVGGGDDCYYDCVCDCYCDCYHDYDYCSDSFIFFFRHQQCPSLRGRPRTINTRKFSKHLFDQWRSNLGLHARQLARPPNRGPAFSIQPVARNIGGRGEHSTSNHLHHPQPCFGRVAQKRVSNRRGGFTHRQSHDPQVHSLHWWWQWGGQYWSKCVDQ
jgi:hypothetical protein